MQSVPLAAQLNNALGTNQKWSPHHDATATGAARRLRPEKGAHCSALVPASLARSQACSLAWLAASAAFLRSANFSARRRAFCSFSSRFASSLPAARHRSESTLLERVCSGWTQA